MTEEYLETLEPKEGFFVKAKVNVKARHSQTNAVPRF